MSKQAGQTGPFNKDKMNQLLQQPIFQITLPLMVTFVGAIWIASWSQNKRFDDIHRRLDEIIKRLDRIETKLDDHETRITRVEERTSPIGRR
jgi:low affinity Fe/Cu permease